MISVSLTRGRLAMVIQLQKIDFHCFAELFNYFTVCFEHQCDAMHALKIGFKFGSSLDGGRFMKNFRFDTICNITQESQEIQRFNCACGSIVKSAVIKYHQLLSKIISINGESNS